MAIFQKQEAAGVEMGIGVKDTAHRRRTVASLLVFLYSQRPFAHGNPLSALVSSTFRRTRRSQSGSPGVVALTIVGDLCVAPSVKSGSCLVSIAMTAQDLTFELCRMWYDPRRPEMVRIDGITMEIQTTF